MVAILIMSAKLANLGLLKINIFWNKGYDIISVHDFASIILSGISSYIVGVVISPKFDNSSISTREVKDLNRENNFSIEWSWFKYLGLVLGKALKLYTSVEKGLKFKVRKLWG